MLFTCTDAKCRPFVSLVVFRCVLEWRRRCCHGVCSNNVIIYFIQYFSCFSSLKKNTLFYKQTKIFASVQCFFLFSWLTRLIVQTTFPMIPLLRLRMSTSRCTNVAGSVFYLFGFIVVRVDFICINNGVAPKRVRLVMCLVLDIQRRNVANAQLTAKTAG